MPAATDQVVFRPLSYRIVGALAWALGLLIAAGGFFDASSQIAHVFGWLVMALIPVTAWRSWRMALVADSRGITLRSVLWTRHLPWGDISAVTWDYGRLPSRHPSQMLVFERRDGRPRIATLMAGAGRQPLTKLPLAELQRLVFARGVEWRVPMPGASDSVHARV